MKNFSKVKQTLLKMINLGYKVTNGNLYNPKGKILSGIIRRGYKYYTYSYPRNNYKREQVPVGFHQIVAYQKFGTQMFQNDIVVRHLDGNSLNNLEDNIAIGTNYDNSMDRKPSDRLKYSINAAKNNRKFSDTHMENIRNDRKNGMSYSSLMKKYDISSKGTLSYILNNKYVTKI